MAKKPLRVPVIEGSRAYIPLGGRKGAGLFAIIDIADLPLIRIFHWYANTTFPSVHAQTNIKSARSGRMTTIQMHKLMKPECKEVDHKNGNGLDNRRRNLRCASATENKQNRMVQKNNSSGFRGVNLNKQTGQWMARVGTGRRSDRVYLGLFSSPTAAAHAYDREARIRFGRFARLNFPRKGEQSAHHQG